MEKILLAQFIGHIIADFFTQSEHISRQKQEKGPRSWHIYIHAFIVLAASLAMTFTYGFIVYALGITIIHFAIDVLKSVIERRLKRRKGNRDGSYSNLYLFFIDQVLHIATIYGVVAIFWTKNHSMPTYLDIFTTHQLLILTGFLLCVKPSNVIIRICLSSLNLYDQEDNKNDLERAGRWIGTIERIMAVILVMLQQYTAIGFIITAKSVLRYNDSKIGKAEYVLIGTLLSFSIALVIGIGIKDGFFESFLKYISCG